MLQHVSMIAGCAIELQRPKMHGSWRHCFVQHA